MARPERMSWVRPRVSTRSHLLRPSRRPAPPRSQLLGSTRLPAELGGAGEGGVSGGSARPRDRYCSVSDSREPLSWPKGAPETTPGLARSPAHRPLVPLLAADGRRAGRRDAGVRQTRGSWGFGKREDVEPPEGIPPSPATPAREGGIGDSSSFRCRLGQFVSTV